MFGSRTNSKPRFAKCLTARHLHRTHTCPGGQCQGVQVRAWRRIPTNQAGLVHDNIGERSHLIVIFQYFDANLNRAKPDQPGIVQLTVDFELVSILRIQTDGLWLLVPCSVTPVRARVLGSGTVRMRSARNAK